MRTVTKGIYKYYFYGFHERHRSIAKACEEQSDAVVIYTDIKNFYPSIAIDLARQKWILAAEECNFSVQVRELGMKFLENFEGVSGNGSATLLVGPMFSHLIGNLVLREIDLTMNDAAPGQYFRYVDDFVLVAPEGHAKVLEKNLKSLLNSLNLELHPKKRIQGNR